MISLTEGALYNVERELRRAIAALELETKPELVPVLGSVVDQRLMVEVLTGVDVVIHAAAHKHLPICEANPLAAIRNNVWGSYQLMVAAESAGVKQFCLISTDKAVKPSSIMGATKRLAELLVVSQAGKRHTRFFTVRFGNVLGSAGSVMPLWREQILAGGPVTVTDARCERYFMTIPDAVALVRDTVALEPQSGTYVFDMGAPRRLIDMAAEMIDNMGAKVEIAITGLRPGEKLTEELHHGGLLEPTATAHVFRVQEPPRPLVSWAEVVYLNDLAERGVRAPAISLLWDLIA